LPEVRFIHSDQHLIVVLKPAFLRTVSVKAGVSHDSVLQQVQHEFTDALLVHRLDMDTSGLMLFARGKAAQRDLNEQFRSRRVSKQYDAIVFGTVQEVCGEIDLPIARDWPNRPRQKIDFHAGKNALTGYQTVNQIDPNSGQGFNYPASKLRLYPHTGRSHQLRLHMRCIGHPIAGCDLYGNEQAYEMAERLLLHASRLQFTHPGSGETVTFEDAAPF